jgi:Ca2+-binding RTX toxin-like protein
MPNTDKNNIQIVIIWHNIDDVFYLEHRFTIIYNVEGSESRPYYDSAGIVTIGIGFNIGSDNSNLRTRVLDTILYPLGNQTEENKKQDETYRNLLSKKLDAKGSPGDNDNLIKSLDKIMLDRSNDENVKYTLKRKSFSLESPSDIRKIFDVAVEDYERIIDNREFIPFSRERISLLSLVWNNPSLFGVGLRRAIEQGNRAVAWYEIRYRSNKDWQVRLDATGIAKRRYYESDLFGLYTDDANVNVSDAKDVLEMFSKNRNSILIYESVFSEQVANAIIDYGTDFIAVKNLEDSLSPAIDILKTEYVGSNIFQIELDLGYIDYTPVGETTELNSVEGNENNELLLGGDGDDRIYGGGGINVIVGGVGKDELYSSSIVGANSIASNSGDVFAFQTGDGKDIAYAENGTLVWDGIIVQGVAEPLGGNAWRLPLDNASFRLDRFGSQLIVGREGYSDSFTITDWSQGRFGINLQDAQVVICSGPTPGKTFVVRGKESKQVGIPEVLEGTCGVDAIQGDIDFGGYGEQPGKADDVINGYDGDDNLGDDEVEYAYDDEIVYVGNDVLNGGAGNDILRNGFGRDVMYGGEGNDRIEGENIFGRRFDGSIPDYEQAFGGSGNDSLSCNVYADGGSGDDNLYAPNVNGSEQHGGEGDDLIYDSSSRCNSSPNSFNTDSLLDGGPGRDVLFSQRGSDILRGGTGQNLYFIDPKLLGNSKITIDARNDTDINSKIVLRSGTLFENGPNILPTDKIISFNSSDFSFEYLSDTYQLRVVRTDAVTSSATPSQATGQLIIEGFFDGMFGIKGVPGAPSLSDAPSGDYIVYLPSIQKPTDAQATMLHPMSHMFPEHVAHIGQPTPVSKGIFLDGAAAVMTLGIVGNLLPQQVKFSTHRFIEKAQLELDLLQIHARRGFSRLCRCFVKDSGCVQ